MEYIAALPGIILFNVIFAISMFPSFWWLLLPVAALALTPRGSLKYTAFGSTILYAAVLVHGFLQNFCAGPGACLAPFLAFPMWLTSVLLFMVVLLGKAAKGAKKDA